MAGPARPGRPERAFVMSADAPDVLGLSRARLRIAGKYGEIQKERERQKRLAALAAYDVNG